MTASHDRFSTVVVEEYRMLKETMSDFKRMEKFRTMVLRCADVSAKYRNGSTLLYCLCEKDVLDDSMIG